MGRVEGVVVQNWLIPPTRKDVLPPPPSERRTRTIRHFWDTDAIKVAIYLGDYYPGGQTQSQVDMLLEGYLYARQKGLVFKDLDPDSEGFKKLPAVVHMNIGTVGFIVCPDVWKQTPLDIRVAFPPETDEWQADIRAVSNRKLFSIKGRMGYELGHMDDLQVQNRNYNLEVSSYSGVDVAQLSNSSGVDDVRRMFLQNYHVELRRRATRLTQGNGDSV